VTQSLHVALYDYLFKKSKKSKPLRTIPSKSIDWKLLLNGQAGLVWLGHSSYFLRVDRKNILIDPDLILLIDGSLCEAPFAEPFSA